MNNTATKFSLALMAGIALCATAAFANVTVSVTISGSVNEIIPILQRLKNMGIGVAKTGVATPTLGTALNAQTLVGTSWEAGGHKFTFNANGKLKIDDTVNGTWSVQGNKVKISAMDESVEADIRGDKLFHQGEPVTRLPNAAPPKPAATAKPAPPAAAPPVTPPAAAPKAAPPAPALDAKSLTGTVWGAGGYKFAFNPKGKLKVNDAIEGTWSVAGDKVKLSAMGYNIEVAIQGSKLIYKGRPLTKMTSAAPAKPDPAAPAATPAPATASRAAPPASTIKKIDAQTLVGTTWEGAGYVTKFNANGKLRVNDDLDGTWKIEGNKIEISVEDENVEVDIKGDKLYFEGEELTRK